MHAGRLKVLFAAANLVDLAGAELQKVACARGFSNEPEVLTFFSVETFSLAFQQQRNLDFALHAATLGHTERVSQDQTARQMLPECRRIASLPRCPQRDPLF